MQKQGGQPRLWDKARAHRPGIHAPPKGLLDRFGATGSQAVINEKAFSKFFHRFVESHPIQHPPDHGELNRCMAISNMGSPLNDLANIYVELADPQATGTFAANGQVLLTPSESKVKTVSFRRLFAHSLALRAAALSIGIEKGKSDETALDLAAAIELYDARKLLPRIKEETMAFEVMAEIVCRDSPTSRETRWQDITAKTHQLIEIFYDLIKSRPCHEIYTDAQFGSIPGFSALGEHLRKKFGRQKHYAYPEFLKTKLVGIVCGDNYWEGELFLWETKRRHMAELGIASPAPDSLWHVFKDTLSRGEKIFGVVAIYPWEADPIVKALKIRERGISVCEPVGRFFVGEVELGVFEWVAGETLDFVKEPDVWFRYGKEFRTCMDAGILPYDAAGRNVIWDGEKLTHIDFEHIVVTEAVTDDQEGWVIPPIGRKERAAALKRFEAEFMSKKELEQRPDLLEAFIEGYRHRI